MREKIRASQLINRLQNYALATFEDEKAADKFMTDGQIRATLGLLAKCVPDLQRTELGVNPGDKNTQLVRIEFVSVQGR